LLVLVESHADWFELSGREDACVDGGGGNESRSIDESEWSGCNPSRPASSETESADVVGMAKAFAEIFVAAAL
jgi:hypothetical protein